MNEDLEYLLRQQHEKVVYIPNIGNAGDSFITHATYQLLSRLHVPYKIGDIAEIYPDHVIICCGGGALISLYPHLIDFIKRNHAICRKFILLPHTIRAYGDTLRELRKNCFVFCREKPSYDFARQHAVNANTFLAHDIAFLWDSDETILQIRNQRVADAYHFLRSFRVNVGYLIQVRRGIRRGASVRKNPQLLNAFRTDDERTKIELPADNVDVSAIFTWRWQDTDPKRVLHTTYWMMRLLSQFRIVQTNRLHVAIMSAMLGLEVHFYDNNYGKNRDVFTHSMQARFPNVHWHATDVGAEMS